jgi:hypothetical protein
MTSPKSLLPAVAAVALAAWGGGAGSSPEKRVPPVESPSVTVSPAFRIGPASLPLQELQSGAESAPLSLSAALDQELIAVRAVGNGRDRLRLQITHIRGDGLVLQAEPGLCFASGANRVVNIYPETVVLTPGSRAEVSLATLAPCSSNRFGEGNYQCVTPDLAAVAALAPLLEFAHAHREIALPALQTAALALTENLPLSAVAKFTSAAGEFKSRFDTDAFRVDPIDLISALSVIRKLGVDEERIAMTIDPQLKIEAMLHPLSRVAAMQYYAIHGDCEWDFWKTELLSGAVATRHYALFGIARYFPDVALEMLPRWARESRTLTIYRLSALQALADTQRPEAVQILQSLKQELAPDAELGPAAAGAALYAAQRHNASQISRVSIAFRGGSSYSENSPGLP